MNSALMMLVDGRFPAGGHTNSAGVEAAVRLGDVHDDATLERYLVGRLATTGMVDAAFSAHVAALVDPTEGVLDEIDAEYASRVLSPRLRDASRRFGRQMLRAGATVWSAPMIDTIARSKVAVHQPVVLGALVAASGGTAARCGIAVVSSSLRSGHVGRGSIAWPRSDVGRRSSGRGGSARRSLGRRCGVVGAAAGC